MNIGNLCKIEIYRFFHSMEIIKYVIIFPLMLFFMSYINIAHMDRITDKFVWASMSSVFLYLLTFICAVIAVYVGREFRQKTINYEIMRGYSFCKIALSKTGTCGIFIVGFIWLCMIIYLGIFSAIFEPDYLIRILFVFVLFFHVSSCVMLYVLLFKSTVIGGTVGFVRFFAEAAIMSEIADYFLSKYGVSLIAICNVFNQWYALVDVETPLSKELMVAIVAVTIIEYGILLGLLKCVKINGI